MCYSLNFRRREFEVYWFVFIQISGLELRLHSSSFKSCIEFRLFNHMYSDNLVYYRCTLFVGNMRCIYEPKRHFIYSKYFPSLVMSGILSNSHLDVLCDRTELEDGDCVPFWKFSPRNQEIL